MRKVVIALYFIVSLLILCSCAAPANPISEPSPTSVQTSADISPSPNITTTPTATPVTTQPLEPTPTPEPTSSDNIGITFYNKVPDDLVIIADCEGTILYGYAIGKWITHTEATKYFDENMVFYQYNIEGLVRTLKTVGITEKAVWYELSGLNSEESADYGLHYAMEFEDNPEIIRGTIITNVAPDMLPKTANLEVSSKLKSRIQSYLDFNFGTDSPKPNIISVTSVDLTGDAKDEILVNVNNYSQFEDGTGKQWYSLMLIIDSDNTVYVLQEDAFIGENEEDELNYGSFYLVSDFDSDGICEILFDENGYECYGIFMYTYNGYYDSLVLHTGACS